MDLTSDALYWPVNRLRSALSNLLFYLDVPNASETGSEEWLVKTTREISRDFNAVATAIADPSERDRVSKLRVDATHFANILNANPGIRLGQWNHDFPDCMSRLRTFIRELEAVESHNHKATSKEADLPLPTNTREYSKPLRFSTWYTLFKAAKYSENESVRSFRDWVVDQIKQKNATRNTRNGPICFDLELLKRYQVTPE